MSGCPVLETLNMNITWIYKASIPISVYFYAYSARISVTRLRLRGSVTVETTRQVGDLESMKGGAKSSPGRAFCTTMFVDRDPENVRVCTSFDGDCRRRIVRLPVFEPNEHEGRRVTI